MASAHVISPGEANTWATSVHLLLPFTSLATQSLLVCPVLTYCISCWLNGAMKLPSPVAEKAVSVWARKVAYTFMYIRGLPAFRLGEVITNGVGGDPQGNKHTQQHSPTGIACLTARAR